jgi:hypothetical protein
MTVSHHFNTLLKLVVNISVDYCEAAIKKQNVQTLLQDALEERIS